MKNAYVAVTLNGEKVGVAMVDNNRLLINIHDNRLRHQLWGTADKPGFAEISLDSFDDSSKSFTIHKN